MALAGTVVLSPVLLALAVWVRLDSKGPVFFRQKRVGKGKRLFDILKFRTMYADTPHDVPTHLLQNPDAAGAFCAVPVWTSCRSCSTSSQGK